MNTADLSMTSSEAHRVFVPRSPGVEFCVLRRHADGGLTFLIRMEKGARAERHGHPGGEESFILSGKLRVDRRVNANGQPRPDVTLDVGGHLFVPPGEVHEGFAEEATTLLVNAPGGIVRSGR